MEALLWLFPRPLPVPAAGRTWQILPLRLRDISALLHAFWESDGGNPMNRHRGGLKAAREACGGDYLAETDAGRTYADLLREAMAGAEVDTEAGLSDLLNSLFHLDGGVPLFLKTLIGRTYPDFDDEAAASLAAMLDGPDLDALISAGLAIHPLDELNVLMDPGAAGGGTATDWGRAIVEVVQDTGWTLDQVGELTLGQLGIVRAGGKFEPGRIRSASPERTDRIGDRRMRLFGAGQGDGAGTHEP
jgi:hypothetical protein